MDRKRALLILGVLYSACGVGIGAVSYGQKEELPAKEEVVVREEITEVEEKVIEVVMEESEEQTSEEQSSEESTIMEVEEEKERKYIATAINVGKSRLRIRESGSLQGRIISFMRNGNVAEVIELGEEWHLILFQGVEGYVSAKYLEVTEVQEETETEEIGVNASE